MLRHRCDRSYPWLCPPVRPPAPPAPRARPLGATFPPPPAPLVEFEGARGSASGGQCSAHQR
eukprot:1088397-Prorocentrum_minimum.AAC.2